MESGKGGSNYWPGFVDALTNVVIAMVFVIVVLAIALSFAAQLMGKRVAEEAIKRHVAAAAAAASTAASPSAPTAPDDATPADAPQPARIAVRGRERPASAAGGTLRQNQNLLQLDFAPTALTLDEEASQRFRQALSSRQAQAAKAQAQVQVVAIGPDMQLSENQRSAYVRVMAVRNELLDQGYAAERIRVRIDTQRSAPGPAVTVSISPSP